METIGSPLVSRALAPVDCNRAVSAQDRAKRWEAAVALLRGAEEQGVADDTRFNRA